LTDLVGLATLAAAGFFALVRLVAGFLVDDGRFVVLVLAFDDFLVVAMRTTIA
jgi:hypothetical protein